MAFFTRKDIGRVYVIKMTLPGEVVIHKIGMCHSARSLDRMMEILRSWFSSYRFVPYTELRLDLQTEHPKELESYIHKVLRYKQFLPMYKVDGAQEMFIGIDELRVITHLRQFDPNNFPLKLSDKDYDNICQLISP